MASSVSTPPSKPLRHRSRLSVRSLWSAQGVGLVLAVIIIVVVVAPIVLVAAGSFWSAPFIREAGTVTLRNYHDFLTDPATPDLLFTTLKVMAATALIAVVTGGLLAWIVARTDIPFRSVAWFLPVTPLLLSGLLRDTAWVGLYSPESGIVNRFLVQNLGFDEPFFNIFSFTGLVVTMGLTLAPIPYLIMLAPLSSMDPSLEEASRASGAGTWRTVRAITVPLLRPALLSGLTVCAIIAATAFESPVILGLPGGVHTFMASIYSVMSTSHNFSYASAASMVYLVLIGVLLWWYRRATRIEGRFALIGGRGQAGNRVKLGAWRYPLLGVVLLYFLIGFVQLLAAAVYLSLVPYYTVTSDELPPMSLDNYHEALSAVGTVTSIKNSLVVATEAAVLCVIAALILALVSFKTNIRGRRTAELAGTLPLAFPPLIFSVALLITFLSVPGLQRFYNTPVLLLIGLVVVFLPFGLRVISGSVISVGDQLLEASRASGASSVRTLRSILIPLLVPALASAAGIVFILSFRELGAVALVVPPGDGLMMTQTFTLWFSGRYGAVHALNVLAFLITAAVLVLTLLVVRVLRYYLTRRSMHTADSAGNPIGEVLIP